MKMTGWSVAVSDAPDVSLPQVELLVMKALSVGLIKGNIDEVDQKVQMTWVQPRVLDLQQVGPSFGFVYCNRRGYTFLEQVEMHQRRFRVWL